MRSRLQGCNPVKYSNRVLLDNDLRVLAAACNHKVPANGVNLEELIGSYKSKAMTEYRLPGMLEKNISFVFLSTSHTYAMLFYNVWSIICRIIISFIEFIIAV